MKPVSIQIVLFAGTIAIFSCRSERDEGTTQDNPLDEAKVERRSPGKPPPASVESILRTRSPRGVTTPEDRESLGRQIASLSSGELARLLESTSENRNSPENRILFGLAISEYAKRSPDDVMSWFKPEAMTQREAGFYEASAVLAKSKPEILRTWLLGEMKKADGDVQNTCMSTALTCLSRIDAQSAFAFAMSQKWKYTETYEIVNSIFADFGRHDPVAAERAAAAALKGPQLNNALHNIALSVAEGDPAAGIALARKLPDASQRGNTIASIIGTLMNSDKAAATERLKSLDDSELQTTLQAYADDSDSVVAKLGKSDPDLLLSLMDKMVPSTANGPVFEAAIKSLGARHGDKSMALIESLPDSEMKTRLFGDHYASLARSNPGLAVETASSLADSKLRTEAYRNIGETAGANGWEETSKILGTLSEGDKAPFLGAAAPYLASKDPKQFSSLIGNGTIKFEGGAKNDVLSMLGGRLNSSDPAFAKDWLESLPSEDQPAAMKGIANDMAKGDINRLGNMLRSMPQNEAWKQGVHALIENVQKADPEMANQWRAALKNAGYN